MAAGARLEKPENRQGWLTLIERLAAIYDRDDQNDKAAAAWDRVVREANQDLKARPFNYDARSLLYKSLRRLALLHRKKGDVNEEIRASRECLVQMAYLDNKDHGKVIDEAVAAAPTACAS